MISTSDFKKGVAVIFNNEPWVIVDFQHLKMGRGGAVLKTKLKNFKTGNVLDHTFKSGETLPEADILYRKVQYLYSDESGYHFMDQTDYEQHSLDVETIGDRKKYLTDGSMIDGLFLEGNIFDINLSKKMNFEVIESPPGIKGDTAGSATKQVVIETGESISVPMFINKGDKIRINTETGNYVERVAM